MRRTNPAFTLILSGLATIGLIAGLYAALHSPLFMVRVVEVVDQAEDAPLDAKEVSALAAVPLAEVSLFDLSLASIEKRLLGHPWVKGVILTKRFPQTLSVQVIYRNPVALLQDPHGTLQYVDEDGVLFGVLNLNARPDLPLLSGFSADPRADSFKTALDLLKSWSGRLWKTSNQISQITYDEEEGFQVWTTFAPAHRVVVILGQDIDVQTDPSKWTEHLARIDAVLGQVATRSIPTRQIYADTHKKIVVRTVRGS
jgi:cell division septal protein FtsQ